MCVHFVEDFLQQRDADSTTAKMINFVGLVVRETSTRAATSSLKSALGKMWNVFNHLNIS